MSKKDKAAVTLLVAVAGSVVAKKVAAKQAEILGLPVVAVVLAGWALSVIV